MTNLIVRLAAVPLCLALSTLWIGCSQEGTPYTEQTATIDPALNPATPPANDAEKADPLMPKSDDGQTPDAATTSANEQTPETQAAQATDKVTLTDDQWMQILSKEEFRILRQSGTELGGTGRYLNNGKEDKGAYHCVGCGNKLYDAKHKFHSGCGWPSFNQEVEQGAITTLVDRSAGMVRTEMRCARCDGHLGHIFNDGFDQPTGLRHCVNGTALIFIPEGKDPADVIREHRAKHASN